MARSWLIYELSNCNIYIKFGDGGHLIKQLYFILQVVDFVPLWSPLFDEMNTFYDWIDSLTEYKLSLVNALFWSFMNTNWNNDGVISEKVYSQSL